MTQPIGELTPDSDPNSGFREALPDRVSNRGSWRPNQDGIAIHAMAANNRDAAEQVVGFRYVQ